MDYYTADLHINHDRIIKLCRRPFATADEMRLTFLQNINQKVAPNDRLFILGDLTWKHNTKSMSELRAAINCKQVVLIRGNHDDISIGDTHKWFTSIHDIYTLDGVVMCHYPLMTWNRMAHGVIHLHGHSHGGLAHDLFRLRFDVGIDCFGYFPVSRDELRDLVVHIRQLGDSLLMASNASPLPSVGRPYITWRSYITDLPEPTADQKKGFLDYGKP